MSSIRRLLSRHISIVKTISMMKIRRKIKNSLTDMKFLFWVYKSTSKVFIVWPAHESDNKLIIYIYNIMWYLTFINYSLLLALSAALLHKLRHELNTAMGLWMELVMSAEILSTLIISRWHRHRLQRLLQEIEDFINFTSNVRYNIITRYTKRYTCIFLSLVGVSVPSLLMYYLRPVFTSSTKFPFLTLELFESSSVCVWKFLYIYQFIMGLHLYMVILGDIMTLILILLPSVKLEFLKNNYKEANFYLHLEKCIHNHQDVIMFLEEAKIIIQLMTLKTVFCLYNFLCAGGYQLLYYDIGTYYSVKNAIVVAGMLIRTFMYAYSAENLMTICGDLEYLMYDTPWYMQPKGMTAAKMFVIQRCQSVLKISLPGVTPALGMQFICHFFYNIFSYVMTLRAISKSK